MRNRTTLRVLGVDAMENKFKENKSIKVAKPPDIYINPHLTYNIGGKL